MIILFLRKRVKILICHVKKSRLGHEFPTLVNDRMISPFHKGFIFMKLCIRVVLRK